MMQRYKNRRSRILFKVIYKISQVVIAVEKTFSAAVTFSAETEWRNYGNCGVLSNDQVVKANEVKWSSVKVKWTMRSFLRDLL